MLFQWDNDRKTVTVRGDVGYKKVPGAAGRLEVRTEIGDASFENDDCRRRSKPPRRRPADALFVP